MINCLSDELNVKVENQGLVTGSRAFGCNHPSSDLDIGLKIGLFHHVHSYCITKYESRVLDSDYFNGFHLHTDKMVYNFFIIPVLEFQAWELATDLMKTIF